MKDKLVTVNTTYARIALILLAANLLLTGYTISQMSSVSAESDPAAQQVEKQAEKAGGSSE